MATMDGIELSEDEIQLAEDIGIGKYVDYDDEEKEDDKNSKE